MKLKSVFCGVLAALPVAGQCPFALGAAIDSDNSLPYLLKTRPQQPIQLQRKTSSFEDLIQRMPIATQYVQPIPLRGVRIAGLTPKSIDTLGANYFIVINNTNYTRMSEVYRDNRANGKANFVSADYVLHPYFAFTNRVLADTVERRIIPELKELLSSILAVSQADYRQAEDADVREDIEKNIAYLTVALKLLDPSFPIPDIGRVVPITEHDLAAVKSGSKNISDVFDQEEDFSLFRPLGWYNCSEKLQDFYRCKEWLSRMVYPIADVTAGTGVNRSNKFRRSVLLFRAIDLAYVGQKPALDVWNRVLRGFSLLGPQNESWHERVLYPPDYKLVFKTNSSDLAVTLNALAEPYHRTRLLLAVRRQKPMNLGSASIFEIDDSRTARESTALFRLFPVTGDPEVPWLRQTARFYPARTEGGTWWPVALLDMQAWGSPQAGNILLDNAWSLDPGLVKALPELQRSVMRRMPGGVKQPVESRRWQLLSHYFKAFPDTAQSAVRTEFWLTRRLESAFAGWVDSMTAIAPPFGPGAARTAAAGGQGSEARDLVSDGGQQATERAEANGNSSSAACDPRSTEAGADAYNADGPAGAAGAAEGALGYAPVATGNSSTSGQTPSAGNPADASPAVPRFGPTSFHYLDPDPQLFRQLQADAQKLMDELAHLGYLEPYHKKRFADFIRLGQRLQSIAELQSRGAQLSPADRSLLANIDLILGKVDMPLPAILSFSSGENLRFSGIHPGYNLALGRPGLLYIVIQNPRTMQWTLARGALYTYYEFPGSPLTASEWEKELTTVRHRPPAWTQAFDIVQSAPPRTRSTAQTAGAW